MSHPPSSAVLWQPVAMNDSILWNTCDNSSYICKVRVRSHNILQTHTVYRPGISSEGSLLCMMRMAHSTTDIGCRFSAHRSPFVHFQCPHITPHSRLLFKNNLCLSTRLFRLLDLFVRQYFFHLYQSSCYVRNALERKMCAYVQLGPSMPKQLDKRAHIL